MARLAMVFLVLLCASARADNASREASRHFQRGVELYNDGDFRGALVEFKKAYTTWPRANVLYDIGQTEYQLLDYAAALKSMDRYLAETGATAVHRQEVEATVEVLRGRVGRIAISTSEAGCEIAVDDQPAGVTPLEQPVLVSVGPRKVAVACNGRPTSIRHVEVAATETVRVEVTVPPPLSTGRAAPAADVTRPPSRTPFTVGWTISGLLLGGTIAVGTAALVESSRLGDLKQSFPTTRSALDAQASLTNGLAIATDVLGAATLIAVGVSTYLTVKYGKEKKSQLRVARLGFAF